MSSPPEPPPPGTSHTPEVLRGLDAADAARPAIAVLSAIAWEGPALDPALTKARDFLAWL